MSKHENITKAYEHYQDRKIGRPIQEWFGPDGKKLAKEKVKGAVPKRVA